MEKKKINAILLGVLLIFIYFIVSNVLQFLIVEKIEEIVYNNIGVGNTTSNIDLTIAALTSRTQAISLILNIVYAVREMISFIILCLVIKLLGKHYEISFLYLQRVGIVMFVLGMIPSIYQVLSGSAFQVLNMLFLLFFIILLMVAVNYYMVPKGEVEKILKTNEESRTKKKAKRKNKKKKKMKQMEGDNNGNQTN